jgi:hypothetical protein
VTEWLAHFLARWLIWRTHSLTRYPVDLCTRHICFLNWWMIWLTSFVAGYLSWPSPFLASWLTWLTDSFPGWLIYLTASLPDWLFDLTDSLPDWLNDATDSFPGCLIDLTDSFPGRLIDLTDLFPGWLIDLTDLLPGWLVNLILVSGLADWLNLSCLAEWSEWMTDRLTLWLGVRRDWYASFLCELSVSEWRAQPYLQVFKRGGVDHEDTL